MGKIEGKTRVFYPRNPNQKKIIEAIEEKNDTNKRLLGRLDMSRSTFNRNLKKLRDNQNVVETYQSGDQILYRLVEDFTGSIETTIRRLDSVTERSLLDLERGREILTEEIAEIIVQISKYEYNSRKERFQKMEYPVIDLKTGKTKPPSEQPKEEIDELKFIKSIARYSIEKGYCQDPVLRAHEEIDHVLVEKLKEKINDPNYLPAVGTLENKNSTSELEDRFNELEEWIRPLRDGIGLAHEHLHQEIQNHLYLIDKMIMKLIETS